MGIHPRATGMGIRSIRRENLQLGEALRVEMAEAGAGGDGRVHLQYYVVTDAGPWALWLSCDPEDVDEAEASLRQLVPLFVDDLGRD